MTKLSARFDTYERDGVCIGSATGSRTGCAVGAFTGCGTEVRSEAGVSVCRPAGTTVRTLRTTRDVSHNAHRVDAFRTRNLLSRSEIAATSTTPRITR